MIGAERLRMAVRIDLRAPVADHPQRQVGAGERLERGAERRWVASRLVPVEEHIKADELLGRTRLSRVAGRALRTVDLAVDGRGEMLWHLPETAGDGLGKRVGADRTAAGFGRAHIRGENAIFDGAQPGVMQPLSDGGLADVIEHEDGTVQQTRGVCNALAGDVRRGTVDGLEHGTVIAHVGRAGDADDPAISAAMSETMSPYRFGSTTTSNCVGSLARRAEPMSTIRESDSISGYSAAIRSKTSWKRPSVIFMMLSLTKQVTFFRPCCRA
jgi:hypothetical protein